MVRFYDMFTNGARHQSAVYSLGQQYTYAATCPSSYNGQATNNNNNVIANSMESNFQQNLSWPTVYSVPNGSCSRQSTVVYEDWIAPSSPCGHAPQQTQTFTYTPTTYHHTLQRNSTVGNEHHDFSAPALIQDLSITNPEGQQSPDSALAVSSDGLSGSESPIPFHVSLPQHGNQVMCRPQPARSPFEWMKKSSYQIQPSPGKTRTKDKYRVVYTDHQRLELEKEFHYSRYITIRRKSELAAMLGLSERQVKIWFQNRRAKERKQAKKKEEILQKSRDTMSQTNAAMATLSLFKPMTHFDQEDHV